MKRFRRKTRKPLKRKVKLLVNWKNYVKIVGRQSDMLNLLTRQLKTILLKDQEERIKVTVVETICFLEDYQNKLSDTDIDLKHVVENISTITKIEVDPIDA